MSSSGNIFSIATAEDLGKKFPNIKDACIKVPKPAKALGYGTAGFRTLAVNLDSTLLRMGMLANLRSCQQGKIIGLMVTASHNEEPDNGIKMVDPDGGMLAQNWEGYATTLANCDDDKVLEALAEIINAEKIPMTGYAGQVYLGKDTRSHSVRLCNHAIEGCNMIGGEPKDFGLMTTPMLHHVVRMDNGFGDKKWANEDGYYAMLADAYTNILEGVEVDAEKRGILAIDCAHGIGAPKVSNMVDKLAPLLKIEVLNKPGEGTLNAGCGAEFVQKGRKAPAINGAPVGTKRVASFDGDADRVVFHFEDDSGAWNLLDGDKIAALAAVFFQEQLTAAGLNDAGIQLACVQTAYANGASSNYIKSLGVEIPMAKTGVKFVHHKAVEYDIGIYFEANGHGTVVFKDHVIEKVRAVAGGRTWEGNGPLSAGSRALIDADKAKVTGAKRILAAYQLINQAVGDAISDALFAEAILTLKGWTVHDWNNMYSDLPSRQTKLPVQDRTVVICTPDETQTTGPDGLQAALDTLMAQYQNGRAFVRPSGTEDVVRVYAEADTEANANELALKVAQTVHRIAGGVGDSPTSFLK